MNAHLLGSLLELPRSFLAMFGDSTPGLLWAAADDGKLVYANQAMEAFFGGPTASLDVNVWCAASHPDYSGRVRAEWQRARDTGGSLDLEYPVIGRDGVPRWFLVRTSAYIDGGARWWSGLAVDITERRHDEARRLGIPAPPAPKLESLDINDFFLDVQPALARLLGVRCMVCLDLAPGRPTVRIDRGQLERIVFHVGAESRASLHGGGRFTIVTAYARDVDVRLAVPDATVPAGPWISLSLQDTGAGGDPRVAARVVVRHVVQNHGGFVAARGVPGRGTTLDIYLPAAEPDPEPPAGDRPRRAAPLGVNALLRG